MKTKLSIGFAFAVTGFLLGSCGHTNDGDSSDLADEANEESFNTGEGEQNAEFVVDAVENAFAEIKLAQLAVRKSNDVHIREIAKTMEEDYSADLRDLKRLAIKKGISIPVEEDSDARMKAADLETETQAEFNKKWLSEVQDRHKATIHDFEVHWKDTNDQDLKSWINSALPDLRTHFDMLTAYQDQVM